MGIYCRLSQEDRNKARSDDDSESIKNQKLMLTDYAQRHGWDIYDIYSDDDYTGTDHSRPGFNRLLRDAENGKINIVLCKSQSRFTRDMEDVEHYIHGLFPLWGVRFVSVVDNADTDVKGNKKSRQINAMVNEWYLEDMSESIRAVLTNHRRNGLFIGAFAPYGYRKDPANKSRLVIDEPAASVVRRIFALYLEGRGKAAIAKQLNAEHIPCPSRYKNEHGLEYKNQHYRSEPLWRYYSVSSILNNEVYIGNLVQNKSHSVSYKTKKTRPTARSEWIRAEHTHEPVIDMKTWELARAISEGRSRPGVPTGTVNIFSGKLVCGLCGGYLGRHKSGKRLVDYRCNTHRYDSERCAGTRITHDLLYSAVSGALREQAAVLSRPERIAAAVTTGNAHDSRIAALNAELSDMQKRKEQCVEANKALLLSRVRGEISEENYKLMSGSFLEDIEHFSGMISSVNASLRELRELVPVTPAETVGRYIDSVKPDNLTVNLFIDRIVVMPTKPYSRTADLRIYWRF